MDISQRYEKLKEYMESEFGVTPDNIDSKLKELEIQFNEKIESLEKINNN